LFLVKENKPRKESQLMESGVYDHYIAVDWSITNMAIARMTAKSNSIKVKDVPSDVEELKVYLKSLNGSKVLTIEECGVSHWLYVELKDHVDRILICDPYRNKLLSEGPKTDKIDASKLVQLLRANLLKEVFHSEDRFLDLRRLMSGYEDLVQAGVRIKNQRYGFLRICGLTGQEKSGCRLSNPSDQIVLSGMERQIEVYEKEKAVYETEFEKLRGKYPEIKNQDSLPGIGVIGAIKIVSQVVNPKRFPDAGHYLSYSGLITLEKKSGMMTYGKKRPRCSRKLKSVYKTAAMAVIGGKSSFNDYYEDLLKKGCAEYNARNKLARRLAILSWGIFKSGKKYQRRDHVKESQKV
jgi:transposase